MTTSLQPVPASAFRLGIAVTLLAVFLPFAQACADTGKPPQKPQLDDPVNASLMHSLQKISTNSLGDAIYPDHNSLKKISGQPVNMYTTPTVLYMGSDYCPYCASLRWPLVLALMRFGEFKNLKYMRSASDDVFANTATFTFHGARYESDYIEFQSVEFSDREHNRLEKPDARQVEIFRKFDIPPYTPTPGGIPFLYLNGKYMQSGAPYSPKILKGLSWKETAKALENRKSKVSQTILGTTNLYSAAICQLTGDLPTHVCATNAVKSAADHLPSSKDQAEDRKTASK